uniref:Uncharacterized protein n=1 Tax=Avena sativa TaxID=4498 RepID=A0ACD5XTP0_AVESA
MRGSTALMAALLLLTVSLAAADIQIPYRERSEEEMRLIFVEWKHQMGRTYSSIAEEEHRYATFKDNLRDIDPENAAGVPSYLLRQRLNVFPDLTQEEFGATPCVLTPSDDDKEKAVWRLIIYYMFGCSFFIIYFTFCRLLLPFGSSGWRP